MESPARQGHSFLEHVVFDSCGQRIMGFQNWVYSGVLKSQNPTILLLSGCSINFKGRSRGSLATWFLVDLVMCFTIHLGNLGNLGVIIRMFCSSNTWIFMDIQEID